MMRRARVEQPNGNGDVDAKVVPERPEDWRSYDMLAAYLEARYEGSIVLHPRVRRTLSDGDPSNVDGLFEVIDALATDYRASKLGDRDAYERFTERIRVNYKSGKAVPESGAGLNRDAYEIEWRGATIDPETILHVRERGNDFTGRKFAIYFFYDDSTQQVVITTMPRHLWTANART